MSEPKEVAARLSALTKQYSRHGIPAVKDVSLPLYKGETLGLVGESGCGKSTLARMIMGLEKPTSGEIWLGDTRLDALSHRQLKPLRPRFQMVFQDSSSSLNPRKTIGEALTAPLRYHHLTSKQKTLDDAAYWLDMVGLSSADLQKYPHQMSGGQKQRVCIARAISLKPELLVMDEPVSALDVSVQAAILNLLKDLQQNLGLTCLFIGHGLATVHYMSHRIAVMYLGQIVEYAPAMELFQQPAHPYTKALLDAAPIADVSLRNRPRLLLSGEATNANISGCPFAPRCPQATNQCSHSVPALTSLQDSPQHYCTCMLATKEAASC